MIKQVKQFTVNLAAGGNVALIALMCLSGYSDRLSPEQFPLLSCTGIVFPILILVNLAFLLFWLTFKWHRAWIPLAGFALVFLPIRTYFPLNMSKTPPEDALKIVSYNVCTYGGNYKYENAFDTIYNYLRDEQPDIVCIQEDVDAWREYVLQKYKQTFAYNDTTVFVYNAQFFNAVGIHTRFPIVKKEKITYESTANGSVAYFLKVDGDTILVINNHLEGTHLSANDRSRYKDLLRGRMDNDTARAESRFLVHKITDAAATRAPQAEAVHTYIEAHRQYPIIVCGDFNDPPISYSRRTIGQGLTDCFVATGKGLGLSYNQKGFFFRIDHILCSDHFEPYQCIVDDKIDFSDHNPVVCWLKFKKND